MASKPRWDMLNTSDDYHQWCCTYVFAPPELIYVDVYDLGSGERLLQGLMVGVVFGRGLPQLSQQQRILHDPLHWFDEQRAHVQQVGFSSVQTSICFSHKWVEANTRNVSKKCTYSRSYIFLQWNIWINKWIKVAAYECNTRIFKEGIKLTLALIHMQWNVVLFVHPSHRLSETC